MEELAKLKIYKKVVCKSCAWVLAREYTSREDETGFIEIRAGSHHISLSFWPDYIKCGFCGTINTKEDMRQNAVSNKEVRRRRKELRQAERARENAVGAAEEATVH